VDPKATLEAHGFRTAFYGPAISAAKQHVLHVLPHAGAVQDLDERHPGPFSRADGAHSPLLSFGGTIEQRAAVAGTLQRHDLSFRSHVLEIADCETLRPLDEAADREPKRRGV